MTGLSPTSRHRGTKSLSAGTSLVVQWLRLQAPNTGGPGSIPGQGSRSHMPQLRGHMQQLKPGTVKEINKINILKKNHSLQELDRERWTESRTESKKQWICGELKKN